MKTFLTLILRECQAIFRIRFVPLWAALWLFCFALWTFFGSRFFETGEASLRGPLQVLPWLFTALMPLLASQLWHAEARPGYEQWLQSSGLGGLKRITAQCIAGSLVSLVLILGTVPMALTVMLMGPLDKGMWLSSLLGLWCFSVWQLALSGLFMRLFKRIGTALLASMIVLSLVQAMGSPDLVDQITRMFPWIHGHVLNGISPLSHLDTMKRGVVDNRNLSFFFGGTLWLLAAQILLQRKQRTLSLRGQYVPPRAFWVLMDLWLIAGLVFVALTQKPFMRFDLSDEKLYSLSDGSRSLLNAMNESVSIKLYFSRSHPLMDPLQRIHGHRIQELLEAYVAYLPKKMKLEVLDPRPDTSLEAEARWEGLKGLRTAKGDIYLGAVFTQGQKTLRIPYFDPRKETQIEYELSEVFVKLNQTVKPILGVITSLPMVSERDDEGPRLRPDWAVVEALRGFYQITRLPVDVKEIPENISSLMVIHPKSISELTEYAIDQFVLRGGHLVLAVDPFCETELSYNNPGGSNPLKMSSTLPILFPAWGVDFDPTRMVGDAARSGRQVTLQKVANNPFHVNLIDKDLNRQHQITRTIHQLLFPEPGWLDIKPQPNRKWEILVQSSDKSGLLSTEAAAYMSPQQLTQQLKPDGTMRTIAGILSGHWTTAFPEKPFDSPIVQHREKTEQPTSIVLFADTDFLADPHAVEKLQVMSQMLIRPRNDNLSLLTHAVEFLGGNRDLISIRSGGSVHRSLTRLEEYEEQVRQPWLETEDKLSARIADIERQIGDLQVQEESTASILSKEQERQLRRLRETEAGLWTERRLVREKARFQPDNIRRLIVTAHLGFLPILIVALGFRRKLREVREVRRAQRHLKEQT
ncbi:Gldg family protein [Oligoflexus tunisiensis]|uniref:Gldg family protein n=1 Tax=Oligoflexus tunisiensis TaxID=708132 RepID=UPI00114CE06D|nr:Gldg family protein [Oligoflexus tunisiensis]